MAAAGLRIHQCGLAAAVFVHPGLGLGSHVRRCAGMCRLGTYIKLQEVKCMRVRMVCIRLPKFMGGSVRMMAGRRRN